MNEQFIKVRDYVLELGYNIASESEEDGIIIVENEEAGIINLVLLVADPILLFEQYLFDVPAESASIYKSLLQKNRDIIHGAFVLDETGNRVIFRDALQLENLDLNEVEGSFNSLKLLLGEYSEELIEFSK